MRRNIAHLVGGATAVFAGILILQAITGMLARDATLVAVEVGRFEAPTALVARPGTQDLLIGERTGRVHRLKIAGDGSFFPSELVLDISGQVVSEGEGGLLGLAFSPTGDHLGTIPVPEMPTNCTFNAQTLYTAAATSIYAIDLKNPGPQIRS